MKTIRYALAAALTLAAGQALAAQPLQVSYPSDASLDCAGIAAEITRADGVIADANRKISGADGSAKGAGLAGTVAVEGMLRTGVLGRAPGLGMFANQAANAAKQRAEQVKAQAAEQIRVAETRKAMLAGMYAGKSCNAAPAPASAPAPAAEAAPAS